MTANRDDLGPGWDDLRLFAALASHSSLLAAGREMGLATSTLSRRMTRLEADVGRRLIDRRTDGVRLTGAGKALAKTVQRLENEIRAGLRALPGGEAELDGTVRITAGDGFTEIVTGAIAEFAELHPKVSFELAFDARPVDLARGAADLAIRTFRGNERSVVYQKLGSIPYGFYAAPSYIRRHGTPANVRELRTHRCIGFGAPLHKLPLMRWYTANGIRKMALRANTFASYLAAVQRGAGIGALPDYHAAGLESLLREADFDPIVIHLAAHSERQRLPHVRAFASFLLEHGRREIARGRPA